MQVIVVPRLARADEGDRIERHFADDMLAIRLFNEVSGLFDKAKRRLTGDWFDVTPVFAVQAIRLASDKLSVPMFSHGDMLEKVRAVRKKRIDAAVKAIR